MSGLMGLLDALKDEQFRSDVGQGLLSAANRGAVAGLLGGPVDLATLAMRPFGYSTEKPFMGSEWIGQKMQDAGMVSPQRNAIAELLSAVALPAAAGRAYGAMNGLISEGAAGKIGASQASRSPRMNDPKPLPQRIFSDDYPQGAPGPIGSRITVDIDGRPIDPGAAVFGRRTVGGVDEGATGRDAQVAFERLGIETRRVKPSEIDGDAGRYHRTYPAGGMRQEVLVADDVAEVELSNVLRHELGHAVDDAAVYFQGTKAAPVSIPSNGLSRQLAQNYSTLNTPYPSRPWAKREAEIESKILTTPESQKYPKKDWEGERWAEAIRAYLQDPNYIKTKFPELAKRIREYVNTNPNLNKVIHLNSAGGLGLLGMQQGEAD